MKTGILKYNKRENRYFVKYDDETYSYSLDYGECMDVYINDDWMPTRIEHNGNAGADGWYLVGTRRLLPGQRIDNLKVRLWREDETKALS